MSMKHYRLKKDLPTFKAGQTFHTDAQGNLWFDEGQGPSNHWLAEVMAYNHRTIEHFPNILEDWFDEIVVPDPGYTVAKIQKLENSVRALDERLKKVEEITERPPREDNERTICKVRTLEEKKEQLREWAKKNDATNVVVELYQDEGCVRFTKLGHPASIVIHGWPQTQLIHRSFYTIDELLRTGEDDEPAPDNNVGTCNMPDKLLITGEAGDE